MAKLAFIVSGIEQSEESRIYQFRAATPAEVQTAEIEGVDVPGIFRFEQVLKPEWDMGHPLLFIAQEIAIDPYGCVTIPTATLAELVADEPGVDGSLAIFVSKPGADFPCEGRIQLRDNAPLDDDPVPATKVGDMVIFDDYSNL